MIFVALAVILGIFSYLIWSLVLPYGLTPEALVGGLVMLGVLVSMLSMPFYFWRRDGERTSPLERAIAWYAFCGMAFFSFCLVLSIARDLASIFSATPLRTPFGNEILLGAALLLFAAGFVKARYGVRVRQVEIPVVAGGLDGLRILQISDLHVGPTIRKRFVERVARLIERAQPDLIVFTGDAVDGSVTEVGPDIEPLGRLRAPLGKYYVPGNHEYYWDGAGWIEQMGKLGFEPLINRAVLIERQGAHLALAGVPDPAAASVSLPGPDFKGAAQAVQALGAPDALRVLLCHQPQFADKAELAGFEVMLSGHTHGGQFFPWTLIVSRVHAFSHGLHRFGRLVIYVSRGTGYWGPPVRLGAPPELSLLTLKASPKS